jgi:hypothetical protein
VLISKRFFDLLKYLKLLNTKEAAASVRASKWHHLLEKKPLLPYLSEKTKTKDGLKPAGERQVARFAWACVLQRPRWNDLERSAPVDQRFKHL